MASTSENLNSPKFEFQPPTTVGTQSSAEPICGDGPADLLTDQLAHQGEIAVPSWLGLLDLPEKRTHLRQLSPRTRAGKRVLDITVATGLLLLSAPLLVIAAVLIKATSPGPIIFTQTRVGLNSRRHPSESASDGGTWPANQCRRREPNYGRPFTIYKLRTMRRAVDKQGPTTAQAGDNRVTFVGRYLRRFRIDELPQLINVLKGEMSMVGPRPECIEYMQELTAKVPNYVQRLGLKPGLTGIAQIEAGYANDLASYRRKIAYDLLYLQNCSLRNDLIILYRTIRVVVTGFGAL